MRTTATVLLAGALIVAACSGDDEATPSTAASTDAPATTPPATAARSTSPASTTPTSTPAGDALVAAISDAVASAAAGCDPLDTGACYLPYPSDFHTTPDPATETGLRVAFPAEGAPSNSAGTPIDVAEWNRNDGFSPSSTILASVADLDPVASDLPTWTDLGASLAPDATVVIVDLDTGERIPLWAEPASRVDEPADGLLVVRPAVSLPEGHTMAVALRGLLTSAGTPAAPEPVFRAYRDGLTTDLPEIEARRVDMESMFDRLDRAGVDRDDLQLAWTFTVASGDSITGRVVHIRDETLAALGDRAPAFSVTKVTPDPEDGIARLVEGTYTVTNFLAGDGSAGNGFEYATDPADDPDALPVANGTLQAPFVCNVPSAALESAEPARLVQYGHGLLGSHLEADAGNIVQMTNEHNAVYCATKWAGLSEDDIGNAVASLNDLSNFPTMADRMQQGFVNQIVLGRLMLADDGLVSDPAFLATDGSPLIDNGELAYDGNSQGGIMGIALAALSPDIQRAVLGVVGQNYSLLLPRSVDFDTFDTIFRPAYPDPVDRMLVLSLIQMLWDRGEGAGYLQHVTADPLKGEPTTVLLHVALGDHQVSELSAYIAARTMDIPVHRPVTSRRRRTERLPGWGLVAASYPSAGSALVVWDSGSDPIPIEDQPPRTGRDPHGDPRNDVDARAQKAAFLFDGELVDVCSAAACRAAAAP